MDKDSLVLLLAQGLSVEKIAQRFGKDPSTVSYWMRKHGLDAPNRAKYAARGGIERERLAELVEGGLTIAELSDALGFGKASVRYWLRKHGLRTRAAEQATATTTARSGGHLTLLRTCPRHGETEFVIEGRGYYRCKLCRSDQIVRHRRRVKEMLVAEAGGCCVACGYRNFLGALEFHHRDPSTKRFHLSGAGLTLSLDDLRVEAAKCVLLCSNCHAEVEGGVRTLGVELSAQLAESDTQ
jgi:transposase-like protein